MRADVQEWPEVTTPDGYEKREAYLEGRLSDEPDLFAYSKLLEPTDHSNDGGTDDGFGSKRRMTN